MCTTHVARVLLRVHYTAIYTQTCVYLYAWNVVHYGSGIQHMTTIHYNPHPHHGCALVTLCIVHVHKHILHVLLQATCMH